MSVQEPESTTTVSGSTSTEATSTESTSIESTGTGPTILAVDVANRFAHLYLDVAHLLDIHEAGSYDGSRGLEFFALDGGRLAPAFDSGWKLIGLVKVKTSVPTDELQTRLEEVFAFLADYARNHPDELAADYGLTLEDALAQLPVLTGKTLAESVALLGGVTHVAPEPGTEADPGGWFHNLMHKLS